MIGFDSMALRATCIDLGARLSVHLSRIRTANLDELGEELDRYVEGRPMVPSAEQKSNALRKFNFYREFEGMPPELITLRNTSPPVFMRRAIVILSCETNGACGCSQVRS